MAVRPASFFEESVGDGGAEQARLCSSAISGDKGLFISVDAGVTENFRVANNGDTTLANNLNLQNSSSSAIGTITKGGSRFIHNFGTNNTFMGVNAGNFTLTGTNNTGIGVSALAADTTGGSNTAVGRSALTANTTGLQNTAVGTTSLTTNTTGTNNTAIGFLALNANTTADNNVAVGASSLAANTTGTNNSALGRASLAANTIGGNNTAVGTSALASVNTGSNNTAMGRIAGQSITTGSNNVFIGFSAGSGHTVGDSGNINIGSGQTALAGENNTIRIGFAGSSTACFIEGINGVSLGATANIVGSIGTNQLGTAATTFTLTGDESITGNLILPNSTSTTGNILKVGSRFIHNFGTNNTFVGVNSGNFTLTGTGNIGVGGSSLLGLTSGTNNISVGLNSLSSTTTGGGNTGIGFNTLNANTTGSNNIAVGPLALQSATTADFNLAFGQNAMGSGVVTGGENVAIGSSALRFATSAIRNMAIGNGALFNTTTGSNNVSIGYLSGQNITTGGSNVFIGLNAGSGHTVGDSGNINIGAGQTAVAGENNTTRIGSGGATTACFIEGIYLNATAGVLPVQITAAGQLTTTVSSQRYKENITDLPDSMDNFMQLRPVSFTYISDETHAPQMGLIAEEVELLYPELVVYNDNDEVETVRYPMLYALLIKMIQENRILLEKNDNLIQQLCLATGVVYA